MRLLLDTHIASWSVVAPERLSRVAQGLLTTPDHTLHVSDVSLWEVAIKRSLGRKSAAGLPASVQAARAAFEAAGFDSLPIRYDHIRAYEDLASGAGDPFDRLLVAQALSEPMRLVTHDRRVAAYSDTIILV